MGAAKHARVCVCRGRQPHLGCGGSRQGRLSRKLSQQGGAVPGKVTSRTFHCMPGPARLHSLSRVPWAVLPRVIHLARSGSEQEGGACCAGWSERARGSNSSCQPEQLKRCPSSRAWPSQPRLLLCSWQGRLCPQGRVLAIRVHQSSRTCAAGALWLSRSGAASSTC